ncbi:TIGR00366 family protein [Algoriphagus machipongonensis]|uniref:Short-chain fatty acids transporter n=1 Tax=Algoriphagus machipongonensis TaxID=388413 RepID=A3HU30_9BACT|nr:TIGR00366 family protein [Algoriphagus machipongonensis]EAZ81652.1 short-chain fatty acids transporter [Algoriphagus machipongonensis]
MEKLGEKFTELFKKYLPDAFVFALVLTLLTALFALIWTDTSVMGIIEAWYQGFWMLLEFGMQMILLLVTGYSIALATPVKRFLFKITQFIQTPRQLYPFIIIIGMLLSAVSWGWIVITAVLARELALRMKGVNYPYLIACVYFSGVIWVSGFSSSIPLLLNTENNYLIEAGILSNTIPTSYTLGSYLNLSIIAFSLIIGPLLMFLLIPKKGQSLEEMLVSENPRMERSLKEEENSMKLPENPISDKLNSSPIFQYILGFMGLAYIIYHFSSRGLDINLNIMIFIFIIMGLFLHKTPMRYGIVMKRSSSNISGVLFQFPFYAGIMGIMIYTGLGDELTKWMVSVATINTYPLLAFFNGAIVNFAIPSAGGEFAVVGPSIINAVKEIGIGLPEAEVTKMIARASLSVAFGESLTNCLQPFYLLIVLPVMGIGIKIQARDVIGFLFIPFVIFLVSWALMVVFVPL